MRFPRRALWVAVLLGAGCSTGRVDYAEPVVLFVSPDPAEIGRLKAELGDDFYVVAADAMWYRAEAAALLDSLGIPHLEVRRGAARFLVEGRPRRVSWVDAEQRWFSVLYDGRREPRLSPDVELREALADFPLPPGRPR